MDGGDGDRRERSRLCAASRAAQQSPTDPDCPRMPESKRSSHRSASKKSKSKKSEVNPEGLGSKLSPSAAGPGSKHSPSPAGGGSKRSPDPAGHGEKAAVENSNKKSKHSTRKNEDAEGGGAAAPAPAADAGSKRSKRSHKSNSKRSKRSQKSNKELGPPDADKFEDLKKEAIKTRQSQIKSALTNNKTGPNLKPTAFDKTQWEHTRWAEDCKVPEDRPDPKSGKSGTSKTKTEEPVGLTAPETVSVTEVPGDTKQTAMELGELLLDFPLISLIICGVEGGICFLTWLFIVVGSNMLLIGSWIATVNLFFCMGTLGFTALAIWKRWEVGNKEIKPGIKRYYIRGLYKHLFFNFHFWRLAAYFVTWAITVDLSRCTFKIGNVIIKSHCNDPPYAQAMYITAAVLCVIAMPAPIIHLYAIKKRRIFAIIYYDQ